MATPSIPPPSSLLHRAIRHCLEDNTANPFAANYDHLEDNDSFQYSSTDRRRLCLARLNALPSSLSLDNPNPRFYPIAIPSKLYEESGASFQYPRLHRAKSRARPVLTGDRGYARYMFADSFHALNRRHHERAMTRVSI